jgi:outer membrane protein assembly factor BamA
MQITMNSNSSTYKRSIFQFALATFLGTMSLTPDFMYGESVSSTPSIAPDNAPSELNLPDSAPEDTSLIRSTEDGWIDISGFLDQAYGFVPVAMPITEPAIGYGLGGGLIFIDKPNGKEKAGFGRPDLTGVGGLTTENGTWGIGAFDVRHWREDTLQTQVALFYASVNLDFYGLSDSSVLKDQPLSYNLEPLGGFVQIKTRLADSLWWTGFNFTQAITQAQFDASDATPGLPDYQKESRVSGLTPSFSFDSRNNIFTPTNGTYFEAAIGLFSPVLGSDDEFQRSNLTLIQYLQLASTWTLGLRADAYVSSGDVPFYMRPYVTLRGVPAMHYQGESEAQAEAELRWQFWRRFSVVGFVGYGATWNDYERFEQVKSVMTGGAGFRYEIARKYGLHMGLDVAFGPDDEPAIYIQFGSAWMRM